LLEKLIDDSLEGMADDQREVVRGIIGSVMPCISITQEVLDSQERDENVLAIMHPVRMVRTLAFLISYRNLIKHQDIYVSLAADNTLHDTWETLAKDEGNTRWLREQIYGTGLGDEDYLIDIARTHANENHDPVDVQTARMLTLDPYTRFRLIVSKLNDIYDNSKTTRTFTGEADAIKRFFKASYYMDWVNMAVEDVAGSEYSHLLSLPMVYYMGDMIKHNLEIRKRNYAEQIKAARKN